MKARNLLLPAALLVSGTVFADISYNYVDIGWGAVSVDVAAPLDGKGTGPRLFASHEIYGPFTVYAGAARTDFSDDNIDLDDIEFGVGWNHALGADASVFLEAGYAYTDIKFQGSPSYDQDGYGARLGYRAENKSPWEFIGTIDYINVESGVEFGGGMTLTYDVTRRFAVAGGATYFDDSVLAFLGVRYFFDQKH